MQIDRWAIHHPTKAPSVLPSTRSEPLAIQNLHIRPTTPSAHKLTLPVASFDRFVEIHVVGDDAVGEGRGGDRSRLVHSGLAFRVEEEIRVNEIRIGSELSRRGFVDLVPERDDVLGRVEVDESLFTA